MRRNKLAVAVLGTLLSMGAQAGTYVLHASKWGPSQQAAVEKAGGTVTFSHSGAGVALVESTNPNLLSVALAGGVIAGGALDRVVQWTDPITMDLDQSAVNPVNDPLSFLQWSLTAVDAPGAWALGYTGQGVRVAVIDGGIHSTHPDLAANIDTAAARSFVTGGVAGLGGCPATAYNCDTGTFWHGTHVAGIIAAIDNTQGVVGIAPKATIVPVKALHAGSGSFGAVIGAILYAGDPSAAGGRADIINMSLGALFPKNDVDASELRHALSKAVNYAVDNGTLVVAAAGNESLDMDHNGILVFTPAESGKAMAISATGPVGFAFGATNFRRPASYTNYGNSLVTMAGPGGDAVYPGEELCLGTIPCWALDMVLSTSRGRLASLGGYTWAAGTSMASPAVAAVAALVKQKNPGSTAAQLQSALIKSADDEGKPGTDPFYGRGFVNARKAVQ